MSSRGEETQHDEERPRPVRFSIFGQIQQQQQRVSMSHHHVSIKGNDRNSKTWCNDLLTIHCYLTS